MKSKNTTQRNPTPTFSVRISDTATDSVRFHQRLLYLKGLILDEGKKGDQFLHLAPGSRHAGSSQDLSVLKSNTELQRHIRRRLIGCPTTTCQSNVESGKRKKYGSRNTFYSCINTMLKIQYKTCNIQRRRSIFLAQTVLIRKQGQFLAS